MHVCVWACTHTHICSTNTYSIDLDKVSQFMHYSKIYILLVVVGQNVQAEIYFKTTINIKKSSVHNTVHYLDMLMLTRFRVSFKGVTVSTNYDENTFIGQCVLEYLFQALNVRIFVNSQNFLGGMPPDPLV